MLLEFTSSRFTTGGWIVNALDTFKAVTGAGKPDVHVRCTGVSRSTAFLHEFNVTTNVVSLQSVTDLLQTNPLTMLLLCNIYVM